jgi:natural product biosynthesis luciferase-like monooxygenase protein
MKLGVYFFPGPRRTQAWLRCVFAKSVEAENLGFDFIAVPERHFSDFGAGACSPLLILAAIAQITQRLSLRAFSIIAPLHRVISTVEEVSLLSYLSKGRFGLSFASGWSAVDYVLAPEAFETRKQELPGKIRSFQEIWRTGVARARTPFGEECEIRIRPEPEVQPELPIWLATAGRSHGFKVAGDLGVGVLTHLERQSFAQLETNIALYRAAFAQQSTAPSVCVMQHAAVARSGQAPRIRSMLSAYIDASLKLELESVRHGGSMSAGRSIRDVKLINTALEKSAVDIAVRRYLTDSALICESKEMRRRLQRLSDLGVDEVACLIDFHEDEELMSETMKELADLARAFQRGATEPSPARSKFTEPL